MADIQIIIDVLGAEDMVKAARLTQTLENKINQLGKSLQKGTIDNVQYQRGIQQLIKKNSQAAGGYQGLQKEVQRYAFSLQRSINDTKRAESSLESHTADLYRVTAATESAAAAAQRHAAAQRMSGKSTNRFGMVAQQVGYQVGDFFVQVQSGANAMMAFGQQGTQLAGLLPGVAGAVIGIGLSIGTLLAGSLMRATEGGGELSEQLSQIKDQLQTIEPILSAVGRGLNTMKNAAIDFANLLINNLDRVIIYIGTAATLFAGKFVAGLIAAKVATMTLAGAMVFLKGAIMRTGIGLMIVAAGELVYQFTRLVKAAGGFGESLGLLKNVAVEVFGRISDGFGIIPLAVQAGAAKMKSFFYDALMDMLQTFQDFTWQVSGGLNNLFGTNLEGARIFGTLSDDPLREFGDRLATTASSLSRDLSDSLGDLTGPLASIEALRQAMAQADEDGRRIDIRNWFGGGGTTSDDSGSGNSIDQAERVKEVLENLLNDPSAQKAIENLERAREASESLGQTMKDSLGGALKAVVEGTKSASDAFKDMARTILKQAYDLLVVQPLMNSLFGSSGNTGMIGGMIGGLFAANGAAFNGSGVQMFADGGVVNSPTGFRHSGGLGVMGEAGPEAIMPLKRGRNGKLGVQMDGGGQQPIVINQSFNFSANGDESVKRIIAQEAPKIASYTQKQIIDQRRRGGAMKSTFG